MFSFFKKGKQPQKTNQNETKEESKRLDNYAKKAQSYLSKLVKSHAVYQDHVLDFNEDYRMEMDESDCHLRNKTELRKELRELIKEQFGTDKIKDSVLYDFVFSLYGSKQYQATIQPRLFYNSTFNTYEEHYNHRRGQWEVGIPEVAITIAIKDIEYSIDAIAADKSAETIKAVRSVNRAFAQGNFLGGTAFEKLPQEVKHQIAAYLPEKVNPIQRKNFADVIVAQEGFAKNKETLKSTLLENRGKNAVEKYTQRITTFDSHEL